MPRHFSWITRLQRAVGIALLICLGAFSTVHAATDTRTSTIDQGVVNPAALPSGVRVDTLLKPINNVLYFTAYDDQHGLELWKSDGTPAGTALVKDINPGHDSAFVPWQYNGTPSVSSLVINSTLYFVATDGRTGYELWKTNGTAAGTVLVKDTLSGPGPEYYDEAAITTDLTHVNGKIYFAAVTSSTGRVFDLWRSDGTKSGTQRVKGIEPGNLKSLNGTLFFTRGSNNDDVGGVPHDELWKSTGTSSGTKLVKDLYPNTSTASIYNMTVFGSKLFFVSTDFSSFTLWTSDGTSSGTIALKQSADYISDVTSADKLYFVVHSNGDELWTSDGTVAGTKLVKQVPGATSLRSVNSKLFFSGTDATNTTALWTSNGTAQGTAVVKAIAPGVSLKNGTVVNGKLFFIVQSEGYSTELWKSDGTSAGTTLVKLLKPADSSKVQLVAVQNTLFLMLDEQLWKSDGTQAGTVVI